MNIRVLLVFGIVLGVMGCTEKEQVSSGPMDETPMAATEGSVPTATESFRDDAFLGHMHLHAEKIDDMNYALADGDLESARSPANWLSRHDTVEQINSEWMPFLYEMRASAEVVQDASDIAVARAAAEKITAQCQGCHVAAGVNPIT